MAASDLLARARVPLGWALGLAALYFARPRMGLFVAGVVLAGIGEGLRLWASGHLAKNRRLTTTGPYALSRNPLYLGSLLVGVGFLLATGRPALAVPLAMLFVSVYLPVMKREANRLREAFPGSYAEYEERVPLFLPRLCLPRPGREKRVPLYPPRPGCLVSGGFTWRRVTENREHVTVVGVLLVAALLAWRLGG